MKCAECAVEMLPVCGGFFQRQKRRRVGGSPPASPSSSVAPASTTADPAGGAVIAATGQDGRRFVGIAVAGFLAVLLGVALLVMGRRHAH